MLSDATDSGLGTAITMGDHADDFACANIQNTNSSMFGFALP
jgi:hypothetical protein